LRVISELLSTGSKTAQYTCFYLPALDAVVAPEAAAAASLLLMASLPDAADVPALTAFINGCRASFNVDQAALFDAVMTAVDSFVAGDDAPEGGRIFFVQASAGTGSSASFTSGRTRQNAVPVCLCHLRSRGRPILRWQDCSPRVRVACAV